MKPENGRSVSLLNIAVYILTGYGLFRTIALLSNLLGLSRQQYMLAVGILVIAGLLLIYLPLCITGLYAKERVLHVCESGTMTKTDWWMIGIVDVILIGIRIGLRPDFLGTDFSYGFWSGLVCQMLALPMCYAGFLNLGNRLTALGAAAAVCFLPSYAQSIYVQEIQSFVFLIFSGVTLLYAKADQKNTGMKALYGILAAMLCLGQVYSGFGQETHSAVPAEYGMLLVFYLFSILSCLTWERDQIQGQFGIGIPLVITFLIYGYFQVPIQQQGLFQLFLGAAAGASVSHILMEKCDLGVSKRSQDMSNDVMTNTVNPEENKKPKPGVYLENPLPVPKRHIKKEMEYAFEPDPDKLFFDIPV